MFAMFRLTLVLSCAMNFKNYPHDTQICNLKIESSKSPPDWLTVAKEKALWSSMTLGYFHK